MGGEAEAVRWVVATDCGDYVVFAATMAEAERKVLEITFGRSRFIEARRA